MKRLALKTTMTSTTHQSIAHAIAELITARYASARRAEFWRDLALTAIHQLHDQHVEIRRQQRQIHRMAAELRKLRKQVCSTTHLSEKAAPA